MSYFYRTILLAAFGLAAASSPAAADSCDLVGKIKSKNSNKPYSLTFINRTDAMRVVEWLDFEGKPVEYARLEPGQKFTISTFVTHPWMFTDGPGNCHEIFSNKKKTKTYRITVEKQDLEPE